MKTNNITYRRVGDYNIPNLILSPEEANITLGKWGMLHKAYLHKYKKVLFTTLLTQGKLYQHLPKNLFIITKALSVATITALG